MKDKIINIGPRIYGYRLEHTNERLSTREGWMG